MKRFLLVILTLTLVLSACGQELEKVDSQKPRVFTSIYPLSFLVERIGGDRVELTSLIGVGMEAHDFEPSIKQMRNLETADLFVYNGLGLEDWVGDLASGLESKGVRLVRGEDSVEAMDYENSLDPHIWLSPKNILSIAGEVKASLMELDPDSASYYEKNFAELNKDLNKLDQDFKETLEDKKREDILVSHAAFSYMARDYGFDQIAIAGISPEEEPSPKNIAKLIDLAKDKELGYIFMETLSSSKAADVISREAGLEILVLDPIENLSEEDYSQGKDYISLMYENLENLRKALVD